MNEDRKGPRNPAHRQKAATLRKLSKRTGPRSKQRVRPAPITASLQLLINQQTTMVGGTWDCSSAIKCAGKAANNKNHQIRGDVSKSAASRIELGGQKTEIGCG